MPRTPSTTCTTQSSTAECRGLRGLDWQAVALRLRIKVNLARAPKSTPSAESNRYLGELCKGELCQADLGGRLLLQEEASGHEFSTSFLIVFFCLSTSWARKACLQTAMGQSAALAVVGDSAQRSESSNVCP